MQKCILNTLFILKTLETFKEVLYAQKYQVPIKLFTLRLKIELIANSTLCGEINSIIFTLTLSISILVRLSIR